MSLEFKDYFSGHSANYKRYRPGYPAELFAFLSSLAPAHERAWDCATGSGQTARGLVNYFRHVVATDPSCSQIENAGKNEGIEYIVAAAEHTDLATETIDLITVSQALHWFRIGDFFNEAGRVLKPDGILAVWSYNLLSLAPDIDEIISRFYGVTLGDYWPPERSLVENGYADIEFPFQKIIPPYFTMTAEWNLRELLGYISTWSAVQKLEKAIGVSPMEDLFEQVGRCWGDPDKKRGVVWPLTLKVRRKVLLTKG